MLEQATRDLEAGGISGARNEAEILCGHLLRRSRSQLYAEPGHPVTTAETLEIDRLVALRCSGRPLQYLTGLQGFRRLALRVGPGVLVPRPETEMLVERALELLAGVSAPRVVDIGAGSGAIALSLAVERPDCRVWATEISKDAFAWADRNLRECGAANVELMQGDMFDPLPESLKGSVDLIISNPPYLSAEMLARAPGDVRSFEPEQALLSGEGGTAAARRLIREGFDWLAPGGHLVLETAGASQWEDLKVEFERSYREVAATSDLAGVPRFVEGTRP